MDQIPVSALAPTQAENPMLNDVVLGCVFRFLANSEAIAFRLVCSKWNRVACAELRRRNLLIEIGNLKSTVNQRKNVSIEQFVSEKVQGEAELPNLARLEVTNLNVYDFRLGTLHMDLFICGLENLTRVTMFGLKKIDIQVILDELPEYMPSVQSLVFLHAINDFNGDITTDNSIKHKALKTFKLDFILGFHDFQWSLLFDRYPELTTLDLTTVKRDHMWPIMSQITSFLSETGRTTKIRHLSVTTNILDPIVISEREPTDVNSIVSFCNCFQLKTLQLGIPLYGSDFAEVFSRLSGPTEKLELNRGLHIWSAPWSINDSVNFWHNLLAALCGPNFRQVPEVSIAFKTTSWVEQRTVAPQFSEPSMVSVKKLKVNGSDGSSEHRMFQMYSFRFFPLLATTFPNLKELHFELHSPQITQVVMKNVFLFASLTRLNITCKFQTASDSIEHSVFFGPYNPAKSHGLLDLQNLEELVINVPYVNVESIMITEGFLKMQKLKKLIVPDTWEQQFKKTKCENILKDILKLQYIRTNSNRCSVLEYSRGIQAVCETLIL